MYVHLKSQTTYQRQLGQKSHLVMTAHNIIYIFLYENHKLQIYQTYDLKKNEDKK